ncbi:hypothetical protein FRC11_009913 [Ceratobasidium sp. 423]|nr:hypothetical protein FRC11_009913 [Ceratobasidium sp. 423]
MVLWTDAKAQDKFARILERQELILALGLDHRALLEGGGGSSYHREESISATDAFVQRMGSGVDEAPLSDVALGEGLVGGVIDETPVFEAEGGFFDPGTGKTVAQLGHPVVSTT